MTKRRLPAEWEPQTAVLISWPHAGTDWAPTLPAVQSCYLQIAQAVCRHQHLLVVVNDEAARQGLQQLFQRSGIDPDRYRLFICPTDDTWIRDYGPLGVLDERGRARLIDFRFNAWGGKFAATQDDRVSALLAEHGAFGDTPLEAVDFVLEGGAVETDGQGTLLATRHALITDSRNPGRSQAQVEHLLSERLGLQRFYWLDHGQLSGDDTDGHIDTLARFAPGRQILHVTAEGDDPDRAQLEAMADELAALRDTNGNAYRLLPLPSAGIVRSADGRRLPASYANYLIINGALLMPVYGVANDDAACEVVAASHPGRELIAIDCRALIAQNGSLHCATMQLPEAVAAAT